MTREDVMRRREYRYQRLMARCLDEARHLPSPWERWAAWAFPWTLALFAVLALIPVTALLRDLERLSPPAPGFKATPAVAPVAPVHSNTIVFWYQSPAPNSEFRYLGLSREPVGNLVPTHGATHVQVR